LEADDRKAINALKKYESGGKMSPKEFESKLFALQTEQDKLNKEMRHKQESGDREGAEDAYRKAHEITKQMNRMYAGGKSGPTLDELEKHFESQMSEEIKAQREKDKYHDSIAPRGLYGKEKVLSDKDIQKKTTNADSRYNEYLAQDDWVQQGDLLINRVTGAIKKIGGKIMVRGSEIRSVDERFYKDDIERMKKEGFKEFKFSGDDFRKQFNMDDGGKASARLNPILMAKARKRFPRGLGTVGWRITAGASQKPVKKSGHKIINQYAYLRSDTKKIAYFNPEKDRKTKAKHQHVPGQPFSGD
jgi:hypothetical protein